jgi:ankyrin repeat protein
MLRTSLLLLGFLTFVVQAPTEAFYQSIRNNDLSSLRALVKENGANVSDARGQTPLMLAAAFGSVEAMQLLVDGGANVKAASNSGLTALHLGVGDIRKVRLLVERGADIHATSQMGRTPLLVAAYTTGSFESVKFLLSRGADAKKADATGLTPLHAAVAANDVAMAKLLLESGSDANAQANIPQSATPLMLAGQNGNTDLIKLLLAKDVSVNAHSSSTNSRVQNGVIQFGAVTALHTAALAGNAEAVKLLIDAGANVNAEDVRGMTPLMWAVSTDRPNVSIVRMLIAKGSDVSIRSKSQETVADWARKFNHSGVMTELKLPPVSNKVSQPMTKGTPGTARSAAERSLPILQNSAEAMLSKGGCVACHAQPVTHLAEMFARERGWKTDELFMARSAQTLASRLIPADQSALQGLETGGMPETALYSSWVLAAAGSPPSWNTDVLVFYLLAKQRPEGNWRAVAATRAPIQDGDVSRTALAIRTLAVYGMPARKSEIDERIKRAGDWLSNQTPVSTEDRVMQLLGLKWAYPNARPKDTLMRELIAQQREDGGWAQTPYLQSDAYATGQVLYTLRELGIVPSDTALKRGVDYLVKTQRDDGSWYVQSRAMKIQPYFESGFPYGHDQWISSAATAWATMGLGRAASGELVAGGR